MNIKVSRKWWLSIATTLGILILLWAIGAAMAQGPGPEGDLQPQGDVSAAATVNSRISYQGLLEEDGSPVTGNRNMIFNFYTNNTCSGVAVQQVIKNNVPVTDGLFSVELDVTHGVFWGQGLWLEVEVGGTSIGCQEILPVPYALSLRPEAYIERSATGSAVLGVSASLGHALYAETDDGLAVFGHDGGSTQAKGYGGYFTSDNGVGVYGYSGADRIVSNNYAPGVYGHSAKGVGVYGVSESSASSMAGVYGQASTGSAVRGQSPGGLGFYGYSENNYAIQGTSDQSEGGHFTSNEGYGIRVKTNGTNHWDHGGYFTANWGYGIYVTSTHNMGIRGEAGDVSGLWQPAGPVGVAGIGEARGVYGSSGDGQGVYGVSVNDDGVYGRGETGGSGVYGYSNVGWPHAGVRGVSGDTGMGVYGAGKWGVVGEATSGGTLGGFFYDDVYIEGKLTVGGAVDPLILEGFAADPDRAYEVGDVLCLDEASPYVVPCSQANDTRVVGMVGPNVEIENGELLVVIMGHQGPEPLAGPLETSGDAAAQASLPSRPVVRVKADASYGPIQRGDLLTSSPTSGYAMKAQPVDVGGIEIHRPGTIIGKALEPLTEGQGLIKVFIILQ